MPCKYYYIPSKSQISSQNQGLHLLPVRRCVSWPNQVTCAVHLQIHHKAFLVVTQKAQYENNVSLHDYRRQKSHCVRIMTPKIPYSAVYTLTRNATRIRIRNTRRANTTKICCTDALAGLLGHLHPLLSTKKEFIWSPDHEQVFQVAKASLTSAPTLQFF